MKNIKRLFVALLLLFAAVSASFADSDDIVILYTNDVHSHIDTNIGYAALAAMKQQLQEEDVPVLLVDCGDILQGDVLCTVSKGKIPFEIFDMTGYDFFTLGNHEFDYGVPQLEKLLAATKTQCLNCNIAYNGTHSGLLSKIKPYGIKEIGGKKIAFIGITTPGTLSSVTPGTFDEEGKNVFSFFCNETETDEGLARVVQKYADLCRHLGADYVVILSHLGDSNCTHTSRALIKNSSGIDIVLDGHDHHVIGQEFCQNKNGQNVLLTSTGAYFQNIGKVTLSSGGKISSELISEYSKQDAKIAKAIQKQRAKIAKEMSRKIGSTDFELSISAPDGARLVRCRETGIGNFCADAAASACGTQIALVNGGGIRATIPKGVITAENIFNTLPFVNWLETSVISGAELLDVLEFSCAAVQSTSEKQGNAVGEFGGFLSVHGLTFTVDSSIPTSVKTDARQNFIAVSGARRVKDVWLTDSNGRKIEKIVPEKNYTVATLDFLQNGGNGYSMLKKCRKIKKTDVTIFDAAENAVENSANGKISERYKAPEGRINIR